MAKTATVQIRLDHELKRNVEGVFKKLGLNPTQAITLFYRQIELQNGLPFPVKVPNKETIEALNEHPDNMETADSVEEMFAKLDKQ